MSLFDLEATAKPHCNDCASQMIIDALRVEDREKSLAAGAILRLLARSPTPLTLHTLRGLVFQDDEVKEESIDPLSIDVAIQELIENFVIEGPSPYSIHRGEKNPPEFDATVLMYKISVENVCPRMP